MGLRKERWGRKVYRVLWDYGRSVGGRKVYRVFEKLYFDFMFFFKYYADVKNCGSFKSFGFIYIYIYIDDMI